MGPISAAKPQKSPQTTRDSIFILDREENRSNWENPVGALGYPVEKFREFP
jgi:hypothetical protein